MLKSFRKIILVGTCITVAAIFAGCSTKDNEDDRSVPTLVTPVQEEVKTTKVETGTIRKIGRASGLVEAVTKADMSFKYKGGILSKLNVRAGDEVKKGQVLAELDTADLKYDVKQQEIRVKQAQLSYDDAVLNSASEVLKQKLALDLEAQKLALDRLKDNLKGTVLTASMSGKVTYVAEVKLFQFIQPNQTLVTISDTSKLQVTSQGSLEDYFIGASVTFTSRGKEFDGEVIANNIVSGNRGNVNKVIYDILEKPEKLSIGETIDVSCTLVRKDNVLLVPFGAVKYGDGNHAFLRIDENGDIVERYVETGLSDGQNVEVVSGVKEGETIIIN